MKVYYFSRHKPSPEMIRDLGGEINCHFTGSISNIHAEGETIKFSETDSTRKTYPHTLPKAGCFVMAAPLNLQQQWLRAGAEILLVPQHHRIETPDGVDFLYAGLLRIKKIEIITEQWAGTAPSLEEKIRNRK